MSSVFSKDQKRAQTKLIYRPLDSTLELILGRPDGPLEGTRRIPEADHVRAPARPTRWLSPHSIVVRELSPDQSLWPSPRAYTVAGALRTPGDVVRPKRTTLAPRPAPPRPHPAPSSHSTHSASAQPQVRGSRLRASSHPSAAGAEPTRHSPSPCERALAVPGRGRYAAVRFRCCLQPAGRHPQRKGYRACALTGYICKRRI